MRGPRQPKRKCEHAQPTPGTAACVRARPVGARGNVCTCEARVRVFAARAHVCACQPRLYTLPLISSISRSIRLSGTPRTSTHDSSYVKVMDTSSADGARGLQSIATAAATSIANRRLEMTSLWIHRGCEHCAMQTAALPQFRKAELLGEES